MDVERFDALLRTVSTMPSRRGAVRLLAGLALAGSFAGLGMTGTAAKRKKKNKKKRRRANVSPPPSLPNDPPAPTCAQTCAGCCTGATCQIGTSNTACGTGGAACTTCSGATPLCLDQRCQPCDVCPSGCSFSTVQEAIDLAIAGETIRICAGSYPGNIVINKSLTVIGAGNGNGAGSTLLRGPGTGSVVQITAGNTISLQRLRVTGGATDLGGGIRNDGGTVTVTGCTVNGNQADIGAGLRNNAGTVHLIDSQIVDNPGDGSSGGIGGGIDNTFGGTVQLINSHVKGNQADQGGGINNSFGSTVTLDAASRVTGNVATGGASLGGGIYNYDDSSVTLSSVANVTGNTPDNCAGKAIPQCEG